MPFPALHLYTHHPTQYSTIQQQFWVIIHQWQQPCMEFFWNSRWLTPYLSSYNRNIRYLISKKWTKLVCVDHYTGHHPTMAWSRFSPSPADDMHSSRAEAFGILVALQLSTTLFVILSATTTGNAALLCDNVGGISNITAMQDESFPWSNNDLYLVIWETIPSMHSPYPSLPACKKRMSGHKLNASTSLCQTTCVIALLNSISNHTIQSTPLGNSEKDAA